jgi:hypothetical protein
MSLDPSGEEFSLPVGSEFGDFRQCPIYSDSYTFEQPNASAKHEEKSTVNSPK